MRNEFGTASLLIALGCVLATSGCGRRPQYPSCALSPSLNREKIRTDASARRDPKLLRDGYVLDLCGDSRKCGTVIHLRDMHRWDGLTSDQVTSIGRYQLLVLRELEKLKPKTLFLEDFAESLRTYRENPVYSQQYDEWVRLFGKGIPDKPTDEQLRMLYDHGAGEAYAALHPEASMQMTITKARYLELVPEIVMLGMTRHH